MNVSAYPLPFLDTPHSRSWRRGYRQDSSDPRAGYGDGRLVNVPGIDALFDGGCNGENMAREGLALLQDRQRSVVGDSGWTLGYAAAYCYSFLNSNRFAIVAAINDARRLTLDMRTPFMIFDTLDKHVFNGKLNGMVLLTWKALGISHPGTTCATRVVARRICIQLNSTPFEEHVAALPHLLEMLIHHMIHAYFLVCCGAQRAGEKQDGRMLDGLHFGVLLSTINDITLDCKEGSLNMVFHAAERHAAPRQRLMGGRGPYISLDAVGTSIPAPAVDGRTHCMHDNRNITRAHIMNWQVQEYSKSLGDDWESRGDKLFFWYEGEQHKMRRRDGPPSKYYSEIIWDDKRFAVPKERAVKFSALTSLSKENKYSDIKLPQCSADVFDSLWKFVTYGGYQPGEYMNQDNNDRPRKGPAVLLSPHSREGFSWRLHIQVCKMADSLRFSELQQYALGWLYALPCTSDDPIAMLRDIYNPSKPLSVELQCWTRKFLARTDRDPRYHGQSGVSNYEKIHDWHEARFTNVFSLYPHLREDCDLVIASLTSGINLNQNMDSRDKRPAVSSGLSFFNQAYATYQPTLSTFPADMPFVMPSARCAVPASSRNMRC